MSKVILQGPEPRPRITVVAGHPLYAAQQQAYMEWFERYEKPRRDAEDAARLARPAFDITIPEGVKASEYLGALD